MTKAEKNWRQLRKLMLTMRREANRLELKASVDMQKHYHGERWVLNHLLAEMTRIASQSRRARRTGRVNAACI